MKTLAQRGKNLVLILLKQKQEFVRVYIIILIIVTCFLMEKKYLNLKLTIKMLTSQLGFLLEAYLSVDYNSIDKSHILNIHKYLMNNSNVK